MTGEDEDREFPPGPPPARWEQVGQRALLDLFARAHADLTREFEETIVALEHDRKVTSDHVIRLRAAVEGFERVVEEQLAVLAEGTDPWERSADRLPDHRLYEALGLDPTEVEAGTE